MKVLFIFISILTFSISNDYLSQGSFDFGKEFNNAKNQQQQDKFSYKDMIEYLKNSSDAKHQMVLGTLYATGSEKEDAFGDKLEQDVVLSEKYLRISYKKGNPEALGILGGLVLYNRDMRRLDENLEQTIKDLRTSYNEGYLDSGVLLFTALFEKKRYDEGLKYLAEVAQKGDSTAQLQLALMFKQGAKDGNVENGPYIVEINDDLALYYLNKACNNEKKNKKVKDFCFNKNNTEITRGE